MQLCGSDFIVERRMAILSRDESVNTLIYPCPLGEIASLAAELKRPTNTREEL